MQNNINIKTCSCKNYGCTGSSTYELTGSGSYELTGSGSYGLTGSGSYGLTGTGSYGLTGSGQPNLNHSGSHGLTGSGPPNLNHSGSYGLTGSQPYSLNYTFIPSLSPSYSSSSLVKAHYMDSSNNILKEISSNTIIKQDESYYLTKNNMYNKKLNLDKEICEYLNLKKNCSITDLKNSLDKISLQNKEYLLSNSIFKNKENIPNKKSVIFLDNEGKKIFNLKSNLIDVNCLIDLIIFNFMNKVPESHYYDHNKIPKEITELIM
jgi:hypothetical protein